MAWESTTGRAAAVPADDRQQLLLQAIADSPRQQRQQATLQPLLGSRGPNGGTVAQLWTEDEVYTVVRDLLPSFRERLRAAQSEADPWLQRAEALAVRDAARRVWQDGQTGAAGYRHMRSMEIAEQALPQLLRLMDQAQVAVDTAEAQVTARIEVLLREHERLLDLRQMIDDEQKRLDCRLAPSGEENSATTHWSAAERALSSVRVPDSTMLADFELALTEVRSVLEPMDLLLRDADPVLAELDDALADEGLSVSTIEDHLSTPNLYKANSLRVEFGDLKKSFDRARTSSEKLRAALTRGALTQIREMARTSRTRQAKSWTDLGERTEDAVDRSPKPKVGSSSTVAVWAITTPVARISRRAYDGLLSVGCTDAAINAALSTRVDGAGLGVWNVIKKLKGHDGVFELKVAGSGKLRCEGGLGAGGLVEFKTKPGKGTGK
jgi:hypothetical protein